MEHDPEVAAQRFMDAQGTLRWDATKRAWVRVENR